MTEPSDAVLMERIIGGDREAFGLVVDRYKDPLVNYLTRLTACRERAEDVAQEAFVRLYQSRQRYREQGRLGGYLYRIAVNQVRQQDRRERRWRLLSGAVTAAASRRAEAAAVIPAAHKRLLNAEAHEHLAAAVARLPLRYRVPVVLHDVEGWPYLEIARALGVREGTIKSRINRGRTRLRQWLTAYVNDTATPLVEERTATCITAD